MEQLYQPQTVAGDNFAQNSPSQKVCKHCNKELPLTEFYQKKSKYSFRCKKCYGLSTRSCRVCASAYEGHINRIFCSLKCKKAYRPRTFKACAHCGKTFGPVSHLVTRYCSQECKSASQCIEQKKPRPLATSQAKAAQTAVARAIKVGRLTRPSSCTECGHAGRIEAAHYNYGSPLEVRWLCRSCHSKWDRAQPKGGTIQSINHKSSVNEFSFLPFVRPHQGQS